MADSIIDEVKKILIADVFCAFFPGVELKRDGRNLVALCPLHSENTPSFKIDREKNRWKCFGSASCGGGSVIDLLLKDDIASKPLEAAELIAEKFGIKIEERNPRSRSLPALKPPTIESYAMYLNLPPQFLVETFKLEETPSGIALPYLDEQGNKIGTQMRHALTGAKRFSWEKGSKLYPYGAWAFRQWGEKKTQQLVVAEGASDVQVCWYNKIPAVGVPGAATFKKEWAKLLLQFKEIAIIKEPGAAGESFVKSIVGALRDENYQGRVKAVSLPEKDPRDLWLKNNDTFNETMEAAIAGAEQIDLYPNVPMTKELIYDLAALIRRFIFFKDQRVPLLIATWIIATYIYLRFQCFPLLWINSPVMRCGKSRLVDIIDKLAWNSSGSTVNASPAALFRMTADGCTFLADEVEYLKNADREKFGAIMAIINAGYAVGATVPRVEKTEDGWRVVKYSVYGPKVITGISTVSDTIRDRSLSIKMVRKSPKERTARLSMRKEGKSFDTLRSSMALWAEQNDQGIEAIYDGMGDNSELEGCDDRFLDIIEPLLSIVKFADAESTNGGNRVLDEIMPLIKELGGQRAEVQADEAIVALCGLMESLLNGGEEVFVPSADLLKRTSETDGLRWIGSTKSLATFLSKLDLVSRRDPTGSKRGYLLTIEILKDIKLRYVSSSPDFKASEASEPASDGLETGFFKASDKEASDT